LQQYFGAKNVHRRYYDPNLLSYQYITSYAYGVTFAVFGRYVLGGPEDRSRYFRDESDKSAVDQLRAHQLSIPFFNHHLKNWVSCFRNSCIDNEWDYAHDHPLGIRPNRSDASNRHLTMWNYPYMFFISDPNHEKCKYKNRQKYYQDIGYLPQTLPESIDYSG